MSSNYNDDEQPPENSSAGPRLGNAERVRLVAHWNDKAPLEENTQQVLLQLTDTSSTAERSGLDLVAVLDVSGSMSWNGKLDKLKTAMKFVISKLGAMDRLSIVTFSTTADRLCRLRSMTEASKAELTDIVENRLEANGSTNMHAGLVKALEVLDGRQLKSGRVASIILMSDGQQDQGGNAEDARKVAVGDVAVYTFGFGADQDAEVLEAIAGNSLGGTFYDVEDGQNLSEHFSALLAGLLSVAVQDLKLTVWEQPGHSKVLDTGKVDAGSYPTKAGRDAGSFIVDFGYLYGGEVRNVIVDLLLPPVGRAYRAPVLTAHCTYSIKGRTFYSPRDRYLSCSISRTGSAKVGVIESEEVKVEMIRRHHANKLGQAIATNDINSARGKLMEADTALRAERSRHALLDLLKAELAKLLTLTTWQKLVACLRAAKRSHDFQRFASRGDVGVTIFKPRRLLEYVDQARKFDQDPSRPPPSVEEERTLAEADDRHRPQEQPRPASRVWAGSSRERSSSGWAWATVLLCTALAIGVILAGVTVFAVYLLYRPSMPYLAVSDAHLEQLQYGQDGAIDYLQASITVMAVNNNSKADASFSSMDLVLGFHGADVALLRAQPIVVPRKSSLALPYNVVSAGRTLNAAGMQAMDEALKAGMVPFDLYGKARTRWKVGVFANLRFWTRISCRLRFFFPGNGTIVATDLGKECRLR